MSVPNVISKVLSASIFRVEQSKKRAEGEMEYFMKGSEWLERMTNEWDTRKRTSRNVGKYSPKHRASSRITPETSPVPLSEPEILLLVTLLPI
jgi:hypothetical protein